MSSKRLSTVCAGSILIVSTLLGCSGDRKVAIESAPQEIAQAVCSRAYDCCTGVQLKDNKSAGVDRASCEVRTTEDFKWLKEIARSPMKERYVYRGDNLGACLSYIEKASCSDLNRTGRLSGLIDPLNACEWFIFPNVQPGGACDDDQQCIENLCVEGLCKLAPKKGEPCDEKCASDLWCDFNATKTCQSDVQEGQSCLAAPCAEGLECDGDHRCVVPRAHGASEGKCFYSSSCSYGGHGSVSTLLTTLALLFAIAFLVRRRRARWDGGPDLWRLRRRILRMAKPGSGVAAR